MRIMQQFVFKNQHKIQVSLDFVNLSKWISKSWGRQYFVPNTTNAGYSLLTFVKVENNKPNVGLIIQHLTRINTTPSYLVHKVS
jgi:hypothetical protein